MIDWTPGAAAPRFEGVALLGGSAQAALLMRVLEEIDYGMLLVDGDGALRYANQLGLRQLLAGGPLRLSHGRLTAADAADEHMLASVLFDAQRGRRRLFNAGHNGSAVSVAAVPMPGGGDDARTIRPLKAPRPAISPPAARPSVLEFSHAAAGDSTGRPTRCRANWTVQGERPQGWRCRRPCARLPRAASRGVTARARC